MNKVARSPKVSIIIPVYNCAPYIGACLNTALRQSYKNIEVIIIDDKSTDDSRLIVGKYKEIDPRINFFLNSSNIGLSKTLNKGLKACTGEYVLLLDADDFWLDDYMIERLVDLSQKYNSDLVRFLPFIDGRGLNTKKRVSPGSYTMKKYREWRVLHMVNSHMIRLSLIRELNLEFDESLSVGEDALFNYSLYCNSSVLTVSDRMYYFYRRNASGISQSNWDKEKITSTVKWYLKAVEVVKSSKNYKYRPDLLQRLILERLTALTTRVGFLASATFDDVELLEFITLWSDSLGDFDEAYYHKFMAVNQQIDVLPTAKMLASKNVGDFRGFFKKRAVN